MIKNNYYVIMTMRQSPHGVPLSTGGHVQLTNELNHLSATTKCRSVGCRSSESQGEDDFGDQCMT